LENSTIEKAELNKNVEDLNIEVNSLMNKLSEKDILSENLNNDVKILSKKVTELEAKLAENKAALSNKDGAFSLDSEWDSLKQWITPQQIRFCTILAEYDLEKVSALESGNQLKQNLAIMQRDEDIDALLLGRSADEAGYFRNWIGTIESVFAIPQINPSTNESQLAAGVIIRTPCGGVTIGSGRVIGDVTSDEEYAAVAFPEDPIYSQLSQVSRGDPVLFDGALLTYSAGRSTSMPKFFTNIDGTKNTNTDAANVGVKDAPDYFVNIEYLSKL